MSGFRVDRTNEDIMRELTAIIRKVKDPRVTGMLSIVRVEVTKDMSYAKVYVSCVGGDAAESFKGLKNASGYIRRELSARMSIRKTPELRFIPDDSIAHSARISQLLKEIERDE